MNYFSILSFSRADLKWRQSNAPGNIQDLFQDISIFRVADIGEGPGGPALPPLFWAEKEEMTEGKRPAGQENQDPPPPPPLLAQGLDPPLISDIHSYNIRSPISKNPLYTKFQTFNSSSELIVYNQNKNLEWNAHVFKKLTKNAF